MKLPKLKNKKFQTLLKTLPRNLALSAFFTSLVLLFFSLTLGSLIFYRYVVSAKKVEIEVSEKIIQFQENTYQKVLEALEEKEKRFQESGVKEYPDPFQPILGEKRLSEERTQELLGLPLIQELLRATNLYEFYTTKGQALLLIEERGQIWQELGLGEISEYQGTYSQNIRLLGELKKELTE